jgi:hypothetical protein
MPGATRGDHFRFGWAGGAFNYGDRARGDFRAAFGPSETAAGTWKDECVRAAAEVARAAKAPLWVCASGGIDSEVVCRSLRAAGAAFRVLIVRQAGGGNADDIAHAEAYCAAEGIAPDVLDLDLEDFLTREIAARYAPRYQATNVFRYLQIRMMEHVLERGGTPILGGGDLRLVRSTAAGSAAGLVLRVHDHFVTPLEWLDDHGALGIPYFFWYRPEVMQAYLTDPDVRQFVRVHRGLRTTLEGFKAFVYHRHWPDLRPRPKRNGFEALVEVRTRVEAELTAAFGKDAHRFEIPVETLEEMTRPRGEAEPAPPAGLRS